MAAGPTDASTALAQSRHRGRGGEGTSPPLSLTFRSRETPGRNGSAMAAPTPPADPLRSQPAPLGAPLPGDRPDGVMGGGAKGGGAERGARGLGPAPRQLAGAVVAWAAGYRSLRPRRPFTRCNSPPGPYGREPLALVLREPRPCGLYSGAGPNREDESGFGAEARIHLFNFLIIHYHLLHKSLKIYLRPKAFSPLPPSCRGAVTSV